MNKSWTSDDNALCIEHPQQHITSPQTKRTEVLHLDLFGFQGEILGCNFFNKFQHNWNNEKGAGLNREAAQNVPTRFSYEMPTCVTLCCFSSFLFLFCERFGPEKAYSHDCVRTPALGSWNQRVVFEHLEGKFISSARSAEPCGVVRRVDFALFKDVPRQNCRFGDFRMLGLALCWF